MRYGSLLARSVLAGAVSGALVLGIVMRVFTALISLMRNDAVNLSLCNLAEILALGLALGIVGGLLFFALHLAYRAASFKIKGAVAAVILFSVSGLIQVLRGRILFYLEPIQFLMFMLSLAVCLLYGLLLAGLVGLLEKGGTKRK
jgi:hypothetical protein